MTICKHYRQWGEARVLPCATPNCQNGISGCGNDLYVVMRCGEVRFQRALFTYEGRKVWAWLQPGQNAEDLKPDVARYLKARLAHQRGHPTLL